MAILCVLARLRVSSMSCPRGTCLPALLSASVLLCFGCGQSGPLYLSEEPVSEIETTETVEIEQPETKLPE